MAAARLPRGVPHRTVGGAVDGTTGRRQRANVGNIEPGLLTTLLRVRTEHVHVVEAASRTFMEALAGRASFEDAVQLALGPGFQSPGGARITNARASGVLAGIMVLLDTGAAAGCRFSVNGDPRIRQIICDFRGSARVAALEALPPELENQAVIALFRAADALAPYVAYPTNQPAVREAPPPPQPVTVAITATVELPDTPLQMAIVSQPTTVTTHTIERDEAGRITSSVDTTTALPLVADQPSGEPEQ